MYGSVFHRLNPNSHGRQGSTIKTVTSRTNENTISAGEAELCPSSHCGCSAPCSSFTMLMVVPQVMPPQSLRVICPDHLALFKPSSRLQVHPEISAIKASPLYCSGIYYIYIANHGKKNIVTVLDHQLSIYPAKTSGETFSTSTTITVALPLLAI